MLLIGFAGIGFAGYRTTPSSPIDPPNELTEAPTTAARAIQNVVRDLRIVRSFRFFEGWKRIDAASTGTLSIARL
jgi:hypothetical protein